MTRVLLVEDDTLLARHFARVLARADCDVATIGHALGALDVVDEFDPEVLVVDMLLVGSTALPLLHEMMSHDDLARLPVVMVTSLAGELSLDALRPYGVVALLDKTSLRPDDLAAAVRKAAS